MRAGGGPWTTTTRTRRPGPGPRWSGGRTCRRLRNYVVIGITLTLVAMQVYLYMSTPGLGIETARRDDGGRAGGLVPGGGATNDLPGRRLAAEDPSGNRSNFNEGQILNKQTPGFTKHGAPGDKTLAQNHSNLAASFNGSFKIYLSGGNSSFQSPCGNLDPYTHSALERAHSNQCRDEIVQVACSYKRNELYPMQLSRSCPLGGPEYGEYQGCFGSNENKIITDQMTEFPDGNTPISCVNHCLRSGFEYAGVQTGFKCWCGAVISESAETVSDDLCNISCSGNRSQLCGGHGAMSVYRTGFGAKPSESVSYVDLLDEEIQNSPKARIVFMLTVNGRAVRQVNRLLKVLYRPYHFYYIHVDARQDYLHHELSKLTGHLPNVHMSPSRFASIWGGASLLTMLLQCMKELLQKEEWKWDYFINLSESDYPVKAVEELEAFLTKYPGRNFLKSHGKDTPRFIRKQGLNMLFHECDNHMWRLGSRSLQNRIRVDGGSDWVCLNRDFVQFLIYGSDQLLSGLKAFWKYSLLPAESFFHTVLQNSVYCTTAVNNNLHLTNWHRKQGCKCQYKHIVDWCGCSPNDFLPEDLPKIQALSGKPIYFSRKFEAVINQEIMNSVDSLIGIKHLPGTPALNSFWLNEYHYLDKRLANDISYSYYLSFARITLAKLQFNNKLCSFAISRILECTVFSHNDAFKGVIITFEVINRASNVTETIETFLDPIPLFQKFKVAEAISRLKSVKIGTNYDPKEEIFRNYGHFLGPESELVIELRWGPGEAMVVTAAFIDPSGTLAVSYDVSINVGTLTHNYKMELNRPLRPGLWRLKILHAWQPLAEFQFVVLPYSHVGAELVGAETARRMHSGPYDGSYVDQDFSNIENLLNIENSKRLKSEAEENAGRHGASLLSWIDDLVTKAWHVRDTCVAETEPNVLKFNPCLPKSKCSLASWSTRFPDIKSDLSDLNHKVDVLR